MVGWLRYLGWVLIKEEDLRCIRQAQLNQMLFWLSMLLVGGQAVWEWGNAIYLREYNKGRSAERMGSLTIRPAAQVNPVLNTFMKEDGLCLPRDHICDLIDIFFLFDSLL